MGYKLSKEAFDACLAKLSQDCDVYAPVRMAGGNPFSDTDCIRYGKIKSIEEVVFDEKSDYSDFAATLRNPVLFYGEGSQRG